MTFSTVHYIHTHRHSEESGEAVIGARLFDQNVQGSHQSTALELQRDGAEQTDIMCY